MNDAEDPANAAPDESVQDASATTETATATADGAPTAAQNAARGRTEDFTVRLDEVFQGPLDLLLHLVKEQEVEIQEVRLADVAHAYMDHVRALTDLDIEVAGEFLVIAATLMAIKSRSLLPREEIELEDDLDPQDELIQRLIEYRRFKGASDDLEDRFLRRSLEHERGYRGEVRDNEPEKVFELGEVTSWDLLATFSRLMRETLAGRPHTVRADPHPLRWYVQTIGMAVRTAPSGASLRGLVEKLADVPTREGLVGAFCALLELMKIGLVSARQDSQKDDIVLEWAAEEGNEGDLDDLIRASRFMDEEDEELEGALDEVGEDPVTHEKSDEHADTYNVFDADEGDEDGAGPEAPAAVWSEVEDDAEAGASAETDEGTDAEMAEVEIPSPAADAPESPHEPSATDVSADDGPEAEETAPPRSSDASA